MTLEDRRQARLAELGQLSRNLRGMVAKHGRNDHAYRCPVCDDTRVETKGPVADQHGPDAFGSRCRSCGHEWGPRVDRLDPAPAQPPSFPQGTDPMLADHLIDMAAEAEAWEDHL